MDSHYKIGLIQKMRAKSSVLPYFKISLLKNRVLQNSFWANFFFKVGYMKADAYFAILET